ncbi:MAG: hypothetical protein WCJ09_27930, partial [Planctomycetota bacterium]
PPFCSAPQAHRKQVAKISSDTSARIPKVGPVRPFGFGVRLLTPPKPTTEGLRYSFFTIWQSQVR